VTNPQEYARRIALFCDSGRGGTGPENAQAAKEAKRESGFQWCLLYRRRPVCPHPSKRGGRGGHGSPKKKRPFRDPSGGDRVIPAKRRSACLVGRLPKGGERGREVEGGGGGGIMILTGELAWSRDRQGRDSNTRRSGEKQTERGSAACERGGGEFGGVETKPSLHLCSSRPTTTT